MNEIDKINTEVNKYEFSDMQALAEDIKGFDYVLIWKTDKVQFLYTSDVDNLDNFTELRAFSNDSELHVVNNGGKICGRSRKDGSGEPERYYDEKQLLWGNVKRGESGYTTLASERGIRLNVPINADEGKDKNAYLKIRSYLKNDRFEFYDFRIAGIGIVNEKGVEDNA